MSLRADPKEAKQSLVANYHYVRKICHWQHSEESGLVLKDNNKFLSMFNTENEEFKGV